MPINSTYPAARGYIQWSQPLAGGLYVQETPSVVTAGEIPRKPSHMQASLQSCSIYTCRYECRYEEFQRADATQQLSHNLAVIKSDAGPLLWACNGNGLTSIYNVNSRMLTRKVTEGLPT